MEGRPLCRPKLQALSPVSGEEGLAVARLWNAKPIPPGPAL